MSNSSTSDPSSKVDSSLISSTDPSTLDSVTAAAIAAAAAANTRELMGNKKDDVVTHDDIDITEKPGLRNTKRAAQNRAAQRAFRQRRKIRIHQLEKIAKEHERCMVIISNLKHENAELKDYIIALQTKLIEAGLPSLTGDHTIDKDKLNNTSTSRNI